MNAHAYARPLVPAGAPQRRLFALPGGAGELESGTPGDTPTTATLHAAAVAMQSAPQHAVAAPGASGLRLVGARSSHSLDAELRLAWTALAAGAPAACLLCDGRMEPTPTGGCCVSCGTSLA